jgi:hypothetical protein
VYIVPYAKISSFQMPPNSADMPNRRQKCPGRIYAKDRDFIGDSGCRIVFDMLRQRIAPHDSRHQLATAPFVVEMYDTKK